jgi:hypothetical protein
MTPICRYEVSLKNIVIFKISMIKISKYVIKYASYLINIPLSTPYNLASYSSWLLHI